MKEENNIYKWIIIAFFIIAVIACIIDDATYDLDDWDLPTGHNAFTHRGSIVFQLD